MIPRSQATWRTQFERMHRSYRRLQQPLPSSGDGSVAYDDDVIHFFMDCWHLKDWIRNDAAIAIELRNKVYAAVHKSAPLQRARELANGWKHFRRDGIDVHKKSVQWELGSSFVTVDHEFMTDDGQTIPLVTLMSEAIAAWNMILKNHDLVT